MHWHGPMGRFSGPVAHKPMLSTSMRAGQWAAGPLGRCEHDWSDLVNKNTKTHHFGNILKQGQHLTFG